MPSSPWPHNSREDAFMLEEESEHEQEARLMQWIRDRRRPRSQRNCPWQSSSSTNSVDLGFAPDKLGAALARLWAVDGTTLVPADADCCPITLEPIKSPVLAADGFIYEESAITRWMQERIAGGKSPCTNLPLPHRTVLRLAPIAGAVEQFLQTCRRTSTIDQLERVQNDLDRETTECMAAAQSLAASGSPADLASVASLEASIERASALADVLLARIAEAEAIAHSARVYHHIGDNAGLSCGARSSGVASQSAGGLTPGAAAECIQRLWRQQLHRRVKQQRRLRVIRSRRHVIATAAAAGSFQASPSLCGASAAVAFAGRRRRAAAAARSDEFDDEDASSDRRTFD